jgi:hypothetical protein
VFLCEIIMHVIYRRRPRVVFGGFEGGKMVGKGNEG